MSFLRRIRQWLRDRTRAIYRYHDGHSWRRIDPVWVGSELERRDPEYLSALTEIHDSPSAIPMGALRTQMEKRQREVAARLIKLARDVFGLQPLTQTGGVTDGEALGVLTGYFLFMEDLADEARPFGSSPPPA